ncbi:disks large homolog 5-like [Centruroides sculpturatus]|uniref:disks large homolog 5-like n=1 Tax=Centruroides sculpturatus TaxID=218467 RepID=UPI000C6E7152|nr:disks large homolog 5-like [Centruroides sculpturatus]
MSTSDHSANSGRDCDVLRSPNDLHYLCYPPPEFMHKTETSREGEFYHSKTKMAQNKADDQRHETIILKKQYNELLADKHRLEQEIDRLQRYHEEDRKEVAELRRQQETLTETAGGESEQLYVSTVRKCEAMKEEYDTLHKRYADLMASHSATVSKLEVTQEELSCWRKRYEEAMLERTAIIRERNGLQQQCTAAIRQWDNSLRERNEAREQLTKVQQQRDEAMKEINQAMAVRIKATKDLARLTEERNAAIQEYSLIMSERDSVHKEIERLQEELSESQKMIKAFESQKKAALEEVESLRREIASALQDRDHAIKECNDLREKYGDFVTEQDSGKHSQEWSARKYETRWEIERDGLRKERDLNMPLRDTHLQGRGRLDDLDQANREVENLSRQLERLHMELIEAQQEADVCKRRRDWAFSERDKIVLERESIRTLCDKLRRERDRAVSDLAEALRDSDEVKRQRNEAAKELKELKEKIEAQLEKETRMKQLNSVGNNHSRDSAIDADLQEWEVETFEINLRVLSDDLGFEIGGGKDNSHNGNDSSIFVQNIVKGSEADGKLKVNDCILRINNTDTVNIERRFAVEALKSSDGILNMLIKRRRLTSSRGVQTVLLNLNGGKNHGLILEPGVYVSRITPGSVAAREGTVAVGDRLLSHMILRIPKPGDLRRIEIDKCSEPLGIQIICGLGGNSVFVSSVHDKSLAAQAGLQVGDQLLEVCGINMRNANYCLAANVLRQCGDTVSILVQYNPDKFQEIPETDSSSAEISPTQTPAVSLTSCNMTTTVNVSTEEISSSTNSTLTKPKASPMCLHSMENQDMHNSHSPESSSVPRVVVLKKTTSNLGISLLGGNAVGIFVHSVQEDSPAACGSTGLRPGDQILEYNGVNLRHATAEEAAYELAKPSDKITILAEHNVERYADIQNKAGDSFYIRALCDRPSIDGSLTFHKDDILFIDNTMYNGVPGLWQAWLVDQEGQKVKCGYIPSKYKMEEELLMKCSLGDLDGDGSRRGSTTARRSFFRRKRHQRSNSHDSKELASFSDMSINSCSDSGIHGEELLPLTYQRVERLDYLTLRPVIVVGPLMEAVVDKLEQDFPHMFQHCIPEVMRGSQQMMEKSLQELKLIDYRKRGNHFECTTVSAVKEICDKNCHAILDVNLSAVECLQRCQIYPIVIFLKFRSVKQIREVKDPRYLTEKISTKAAKEMYEHTLKIESEYKHIINAVIPGSNLAYMCTQIKTCVEDEQSKTLWVPCGSL